MYEYNDGQNKIEQIMTDNDVFELEGDIGKAIAVNDIVYNLQQTNKSKKRKPILFCNTVNGALQYNRACGDDVYLTISMFEMLNIDSHPIGTYDNISDVRFKHVMTEVNINNKWIIIDPKHNTFNLSKSDYNYTATKRHLYNPLKYQPYIMIDCNLRNILMSIIGLIILPGLVYRKKEVMKE